MMIVWWAVGLMLAFFWADRLRDGARGMPSVANIARPEWDRWPKSAPEVTVIVPARNEAAAVEACLRSLLQLDYPNYKVIAVDDRSSDRTGEILHAVASNAHALNVMRIDELPVGWLGKPHAMAVAADYGADADWLLFTDADVVFRPDALRRAMAYAEAERADHVVLLPHHRLESLGEKLLMGAFQMLFVFGHRPWKVSDPEAKDFMGLGPFNLIRRRAYEQVGGFCALRMELIEDMKLGKLVKQHRLRQRNVFGPGLLSWHWGRGVMGLSRNLTKNLFALMQFRWAKALGACVLLLCLNLLPIIGAALAPAWAKLPFVVALACIAALYVGMARHTRVPAWTWLLYPVSTLLLVFSMLRSIAHVWRHRGVVWRGTLYSIEDLRKGMV